MIAEAELAQHAAPRLVLRWVATAVVAAAALVGSYLLVQPPAVVDRVRIDNRTGLALDIAVADTPEGSVVPLGIVQPASVEAVDDVIDVGDRWEFVVTQAGEELSRITMTRDELRAAGWRVVVPASAEDGRDG